MTRLGPSVTVAFENPKFNVGLAAMAKDPAGIAAAGFLGAAMTNKLREKIDLPYFAVDGVEHAGNWATPTRVDIKAGHHHVEVYFRLKGVPIKRGKGSADFTVSDGDVSVHAHFGRYITTTTISAAGQPTLRRRRLQVF